MVTRRKSRKGASSRRKRGSRPSGRQSASWEEHSERVRYAVALRTERFMRDHGEKIEGSSKESVARNSYLAGMLDMLTTARGTFGFWGADQILSELERVNRKLGLVDPGPHQECGVEREPDEECVGPIGHAHAGQPPVEGTTAKASKGLRRDPMYA